MRPHVLRDGRVLLLFPDQCAAGHFVHALRRVERARLDRLNLGGLLRQRFGREADALHGVALLRGKIGFVLGALGETRGACDQFRRRIHAARIPPIKTRHGPAGAGEARFFFDARAVGALFDLAHGPAFERGARFRAERFILAAAHVLKRRHGIGQNAPADGGTRPGFGGLDLDFGYVIGAPAGGGSSGLNVALRLRNVRAGIVGAGRLPAQHFKRACHVGAGLLLVARLDPGIKLGRLPHA